MPSNTVVEHVAFDHGMWNAGGGAGGAGWQGDLTISSTNDFPLLTYVSYAQLGVSASSTLTILDSDAADVTADWTLEYSGGQFKIWSYDKIDQTGLNDGGAHYFTFAWDTGIGSHGAYCTLNLWNNANSQAGCDHLQVINNFTSSNNTASTSLASSNSCFYCVTVDWQEPASDQGAGNMLWIGSSGNIPAIDQSSWWFIYGDCNVVFAREQYRSVAGDTDTQNLQFITTKGAWNMLRMEIYPQLAVQQDIGGVLGFAPPDSEYFYVTFNDSGSFEDTRV